MSSSSDEEFKTNKPKKSGHLVCQGAMCKCKYGDMPDKLTVKTQQKHYINDGKGSKKLVASTMDIGMPFEKKTFGQCKLQPTPGGFKPCMPSITQWTKPYESIQLANGGKVLLEDSKATCAIAGSPCVEFITHGQTKSGSPESFEEASREVHSQLNPMADPTKSKYRAFKPDLNIKVIR